MRVALVAALACASCASSPADVPAPRAHTYDRILYTAFDTYSFELDLLDLARDGTVLRMREGREWTGTLEPGAFERLCAELERGGLFALDARYAHGMTHQDSVKLGVWRDGVALPFVVEDYGGVGPAELHAIHRAIRETALAVLGAPRETDMRDAWDLLWLLDPTVER